MGVGKAEKGSVLADAKGPAVDALVPPNKCDCVFVVLTDETSTTPITRATAGGRL